VQSAAQSGSSFIVLAVMAQGEVEMAMQRVVLGIIILGVIAFALFFYLRSMRVRDRATRSAFARSFCFFCSQPLEFDQRFPVGLPLGGQSREVSACREHAEQLTSGGQPDVTAVNFDGRLIPWFAAPDYDPRLDYRTRPSETLPLATVTAEFAAASAAQSSAPEALSAPRSSDDWWKVSPSEPAPRDPESPGPAPAGPDPHDRPANPAS
jgi:hypothetical protein